MVLIGDSVKENDTIEGDEIVAEFLSRERSRRNSGTPRNDPRRSCSTGRPSRAGAPQCGRESQPEATVRTRLSTAGGRPMLPKQIADIPIPDSTLAAEATELVR